MKDATKWCLLSSHMGTPYEAGFWDSDKDLSRLVEEVLEEWFRYCESSSANFDQGEIMEDFGQTEIAAIRQAFMDAGWKYGGDMYRVVDGDAWNKVLASLNVQ